MRSTLTLDPDVARALVAEKVLGFLRSMTHPRVFRSPMPIDTSTGHVRVWLMRSNAQLLVPGPRHFDVLQELLHEIARSTATPSGV